MELSTFETTLLLMLGVYSLSMIAIWYNTVVILDYLKIDNRLNIELNNSMLEAFTELQNENKRITVQRDQALYALQNSADRKN